MLSELRVRNYILIDSLDVVFPEGLVIITGQTGAGKSILLGALSLLLGSKADVSSIGESSDNCVVEAEFLISDPGARQILEDNDIEWDKGNLTVRRVISRTGRSRSFINDNPVSLPVLSSIAPFLVDIHSQHQTLLLSDRNFQMSMLDGYASNGALLERCSASFRKINALDIRIGDLEKRISAIERDRDYNESQLRQLESACLKAGELAELEQQQKQLANAEEIKEHLYAVDSLCQEFGADYTMTSAMREMERHLEKVSAFIPSLSSFPQRIESCRLELEDILSDVSDANGNIEASGERLEALEERISLIYSLMKRHGCSSEEELIALRDRLSQGMAGCESLMEEKNELLREQEREKEVFSSAATALHESREKAAKGFSAEICRSIKDLELPDAVFETVLNDAPQSANGTDSVCFLFSSNGKNPVEVAKCASGGELSRIMLCLKDMMARYSNMPTMVFDEIDTGVSGSVADKMGSMICSMGTRMQVFAITHLPQVAAKGDAHYLVTKETVSGRTVSCIKKLSAEQRVMEVARMLSGSSLTQAAIDNAKSLLGC